MTFKDASLLRRDLDVLVNVHRIAHVLKVRRNHHLKKFCSKICSVQELLYLLRVSSFACVDDAGAAAGTPTGVRADAALLG